LPKARHARNTHFTNDWERGRPARAPSANSGNAEHRTSNIEHRTSKESKTSTGKARRFFASTSILLLIIGCIGKPQNPAATQPVTISDVATTQPSYWYAKPAVVTIVAPDLEALIRTSETVLRESGFKVNRVSYRQALITSQPMVTSQFFEFWRPDVQTFGDSAQASTRTTRRTVRFEIARRNDGQFELTPKVLVERQSVAEQRITSVALYRGAVARARGADRQSGTKESDEGIMIPSHYWYAAGRDPAIEKKLAAEISKQLARHS